MKECFHTHWGEGSNQKEADTAISNARGHSQGKGGSMKDEDLAPMQGIIVALVLGLAIYAIVFMAFL